MIPAWCTAAKGDCLMHVLVVPRAARSRVVGEHDGRLKVHLAAPPVDGEANQELVRMFSEILEISSSRVEIVHGLGGRRKTIRVQGVEPEYLRAKFGVYA